MNQPMALRRVLALAVVAVGAAALAGTPGGAQGEPPVAPTSGSFRALTYNVAGLPEVLSGSEPAINMPLISPLLNPYDLVLVQEDWANPDPPVAGATVFHEILVSQVDHPYQSTPDPVPLGTNPARPSALVSDGLNRLSRLPFGPLERVMWPDCFGGIDTSDGGAGDCLSTKGFTMATTELAPGVTVDVYNLHGEAGSTPLDREYRAAGYAILAQYIVDRSDGHAVIVGGDFNLHTDRELDQAVMADFIEATGLTDTRSVVDDDPGADQIDKFLFRSGDGITLEPLTHTFEAATFVRPSDGTPLSDHDPLSVDFAWSVDAPPTTTTTAATVTTSTIPEITTTTEDETLPSSSSSVPTEPPTGPTVTSASTSTPAPPAPSTPGTPPSSPSAAQDASLARTGSSTMPLVAAGAALLAVGAGLAFVGRRRLRHS